MVWVAKPCDRQGRKRKKCLNARHEREKAVPVITGDIGKAKLRFRGH